MLMKCSNNILDIIWLLENLKFHMWLASFLLGGTALFRLMHDAVNIDLYVCHDPVFYFKF